MSEALKIGPEEQDKIIAFALDYPNNFLPVIKYVDPGYFTDPACQIIYSVIVKLYEKTESIPTRGIVKDTLARSLSTDTDIVDLVIDKLKAKTDPRDIGYINNWILHWAQNMCMKKLYKEDTIKRYKDGEHDHLFAIFDEASSIVKSEDKGVLMMKDGVASHREEESRAKDEVQFTTGIPKLDFALSRGGPKRKEILCYMAATGVGKSIMIINSCVANLKKGKKIIHFTLELNKHRTLTRYLSCISGIPQDDLVENYDKLDGIVNSIREETGAELYIVEDEDINVNHVINKVEEVSNKLGWYPDIVSIDYLELMTSRQKVVKEEHVLQQKIAREIALLAKKLNVMIITATQTNRSGVGGAESEKSKQSSHGLGLDKAGDSYGKTRPLDYIVTISQSPEERANERPFFWLYIAKNRNGQTGGGKIRVNVNYQKMQAAED